MKSRGLAHASYYVSDIGEAAVIDPRRDIQDYLELAAEDGAEIRARNADRKVQTT